MSSSSSDLSRQYISSLSILAVAIFVGVPIWWKTTEVYRCPLPYNEIESLKNVPPELSFRISISFLSESNKNAAASVESLVSQLTKELVIGSISARNTRIALRYIIQPHILSPQDSSTLISYLQSDNIEDFSSHVATVLPSSLGHYSILLVPDATLSDHTSSSSPSNQQQWRNLSIFISRHRHAIVRVKNQGDLSSSLGDVLKVIRSVYGDKRFLEKSLKNVVGINQDRDRVDAENMRQLRATQGYQISFTLLTPDPSQLQATWNIEDATSNILIPFLEHPGMSSLGNFTVSSQEFHYTNMRFAPKRRNNTFYVLSSQLPQMISSVESKLASHVTQLPSLNFLIYVPRQSESPLLIQAPSRASESKTLTDNFLVPQWGGMVIYNSEDPYEGASGGGSEVPRVRVKMERLMPIFVEHLKMLLGVPDMSVFEEGVAGVKFQFSVGKHGIADWRVDQLLVAKLIESTSMATTSLVSLVQLLDKVKNMVISDHIQKEVEYSLFAIQECYSLASNGQLKRAYDSAKKAMQSAEIAFFDPSILELLYFPDDQKFAIYIPLFLPISVPILFSSMAAFKWLAAWLKGADHTDCGPESEKPKTEPASSPELVVQSEENDKSATAPAEKGGDGTSESDSGLVDHER